MRKSNILSKFEYHDPSLFDCIFLLYTYFLKMKLAVSRYGDDTVLQKFRNVICCQTQAFDTVP